MWACALNNVRQPVLGPKSLNNNGFKGRQIISVPGTHSSLGPALPCSLVAMYSKTYVGHQLFQSKPPNLYRGPTVTRLPTYNNVQLHRFDCTIFSEELTTSIFRPWNSRQQIPQQFVYLYKVMRRNVRKSLLVTYLFEFTFYVICSLFTDADSSSAYTGSNGRFISVQLQPNGECNRSCLRFKLLPRYLAVMTAENHRNLH